MEALDVELVNADRIQRDHHFLTAKIAWPDGVHKLPRHPGRIPEYLETPPDRVKTRRQNEPRGIPFAPVLQ
jgi:hypothetical protein